MWIWLRKGNLKRETESLLIAAQNNAIRSNHIKTRIDKMQQNCRCRLYGNRDKIINHTISECSKLVQKEYKTKHNWGYKVIHWELCKELKFDYKNKWYTPKPDSVLEIEMHKLLWDFEIQTVHLISTRQPDFIIINKKKENTDLPWKVLLAAFFSKQFIVIGWNMFLELYELITTMSMGVWISLQNSHLVSVIFVIFLDFMQSSFSLSFFFFKGMKRVIVLYSHDTTIYIYIYIYGYVKNVKYTDTWNIHMHRNQKNTRNTDDSC